MGIEHTPLYRRDESSLVGRSKGIEVTLLNASDRCN